MTALSPESSADWRQSQTNTTRPIGLGLEELIERMRPLRAALAAIDDNPPCDSDHPGASATALGFDKDHPGA